MIVTELHKTTRSVNKKAVAYNKSVDVSENKKMCQRCSVIQPLSEFSIDKTALLGVRCWCYKCSAIARGSRFGLGLIKGASLTFNKETNTKECPNCKITKASNEFYIDKRSSSGFSSYCKSCACEGRKVRTNTEEGRRRGRERNRNLPQYRKKQISERARYTKYKTIGLTQEHCKKEYEKSLGICTICNISDKELEKNLHLDHNHDTNALRGFLCGRCNRALGMYKDNILLLENTINYLKKHGTE